MWCLGAVAIVLAAALAFSAWMRRGEGRPDRPGERTCATFRAPDGDAPSNGEPYGRALVEALRSQLVQQGLVGDEDDVGLSDGHGWAFAVKGAYIEVTRYDDEVWVLTVVDPSGGGPGAIAVAKALDVALRRTDRVTNVRWFAREVFDPDGAPQGHEHPTDVPGPTYRS